MAWSTLFLAFCREKVYDRWSQVCVWCVCVCVCVVCVCVSLASDSLKTIKVIIIKLSMLTAWDMTMHYMLIILTLAFTQGHTDLNRENDKCSITSETVQEMPIKFAVKIGKRKVYIICSQSNDLINLHSRSQLHLIFYLYYNSNIWNNI